MKKALMLLLFVLLAGCKGPPDPDDGLSMGDIAERQVNETRLNCSAEVNEYKSTFCFANNFISYRKAALDAGKPYPDYMVQDFCLAANKTDVCYFYVAVKTKNSPYCKFVKEEGACRMVSDDKLCTVSEENKDECFMGKAILIQYFDPPASVAICNSLPEKYHVENEDDVNCYTLEMENKTLDMNYEDSFMLLYDVSKVAEVKMKTEK